MEPETVTGAGASSHKKLMFTCTLIPGFSKKLEIPSEFAGHIIPERIAKVKDPLGYTWPMNVRGDAPNFSFVEGWMQFAKAYMLDVGYVLIFCYEGDMNFKVIIFGKNLYRKEYALEYPDQEGKTKS